MLIYHLCTSSSWRTAIADGAYTHPSLSDEGFIHASYHHQLVKTAERYYQGVADLVALCIETDMLTSVIKVELAKNGQEFPHIYGPIDIDAVVDVVQFPTNSNLGFEVPADLPID